MTGRGGGPRPQRCLSVPARAGSARSSLRLAPAAPTRAGPPAPFGAVGWRSPSRSAQPATGRIRRSRPGPRACRGPGSRLVMTPAAGPWGHAGPPCPSTIHAHRPGRSARARPDRRSSARRPEGPAARCRTRSPSGPVRHGPHGPGEARPVRPVVCPQRAPAASAHVSRGGGRTCGVPRPVRTLQRISADSRDTDVSRGFMYQRIVSENSSVPDPSTP